MEAVMVMACLSLQRPSQHEGLTGLCWGTSTDLKPQNVTGTRHPSLGAHDMLEMAEAKEEAVQMEHDAGHVFIFSAILAAQIARRE